MTDELPAGWAIARMESLVGSEGLMCDGDWVESKDQDPTGEVRLVQLADVGDGAFLDKSNRYLTQQNAEKLNCTFLEPKDVLISRLGEPLGKACLFPPLDRPCVTVVDVHVVRPASSDVSRNWLMHAINSAPVRRVIDSLSSGTTRKRITGQKLKDLEIRVPPAPEQKRIASKLDELFSRIEEGERALERVQKLVERYRQSVLKAAVTGELTREWREKNRGKLESGEALLARILKARRAAWEKAELDKMKAKGQKPVNDKWKQKYQEPSPPDTTDLPELPEGWVWAAVGQLCDLENGDRSGNYPSRAHYVESGVPFINAGHIENGQVNAESMNFITEERFKILRAGHVQAGDLLFCLRGSLGKVALNTLERGAIASSLVIVRPALTELTRYLMVYLQGPISAQQIGLYDNGTAQPNLAGADLARFAVPLPSLLEQDAIMDSAVQCLEIASKQSADLQNFLTRSSALRSSVLKAAFSGVLVAQDKADEPASVLLERIATKRSAATTTKPQRGPNKKKTIA